MTQQEKTSNPAHVTRAKPVSKLVEMIRERFGSSFDNEATFDGDELEEIIAALEANQPPSPQSQPFAWYWHDQNGCLYITGDDRKPEVPAGAKPLYEHPPQGQKRPALVRQSASLMPDSAQGATELPQSNEESTQYRVAVSTEHLDHRVESTAENSCAYNDAENNDQHEADQCAQATATIARKEHEEGNAHHKTDNQKCHRYTPAPYELNSGSDATRQVSEGGKCAS